VATGLAHQVVVDNVGNTVRLRRVSDNVFVRNLVSAPADCIISAGSSVTFNTNGTASGQGNVRIQNQRITADDNVITVTLGTGRVRIQ